MKLWAERADGNVVVLLFRLCNRRHVRYSPSMLRRRLSFRLFAITFVALQLVLRGAAGIADARLSAASGPWEHYVHVESKGSNHIPPEHGTDCGLCSYLSASFTGAQAVAVELFAAQQVAPVVESATLALRGTAALLPPARAPPAV
jgi:hypothetical protein